METSLILDNIVSKRKHSLLDREPVTRRQLQEETDKLVESKTFFIQQNASLWNILASSAATTKSGNYEWAQRNLEQNEQRIKKIDERLGIIKNLLEQENIID